MGHRQAFAWIDEWIEMNYDDVKKYESTLQKQTNKIVQKKPSVETPTEIDSLAVTEENEVSSSGSVTPIGGITPVDETKEPVRKGYFSWF